MPTVPDDVRPDEVWRVTTSAGHQLHGLEWVPSEPSGPDVLLLHGLASNARLWGGVGRRLAAAGHRAVAYDQRGHGHSERAEDGFAWGGVIDDLVGVAAALDLDRPVVVGQSWGGNVVLEAAARVGERVRGAMTVDGGFFDLQAQFGDADAAWAALTPPSFDDSSWDVLVGHMARRTEGWPPDALSAQLANITRTPPGGVAPALRRQDHEQVVRRMFEQRPRDSASRATVPVLLGACRGPDTSADRAEAVDAVLTALPSGRVHWFEDADHDVHVQRPEEVVAVLRAAIADGFLDGTA